MFTAATGLAILHVLDDAFIGKQPGTTAGDHLPTAGGAADRPRVIGFFDRRLLGSS